MKYEIITDLSTTKWILGKYVGGGGVDWIRVAQDSDQW
jgi:hypothetical protein